MTADYPCGHPRTPVNTYTHIEKNQSRPPHCRCKTCKDESSRRRSQPRRLREAVARQVAKEARIAARWAEIDHAWSLEMAAKDLGIQLDSLRCWIDRNPRRSAV